MRSVLGSALLGFALAMVAIGASAQQAKNPEVGTWKLNVEKSKYSPGTPAKSGMITVEAAGNGVKYSLTTVDAQGKATSSAYSASYDGKDMPYTGSTVADTTSLRRVDAYTVERVDKKAGKVVTTIRREYSKDGKSFVAKIKGTNAKGEPVDSVLVWERM